MRRLVTVLAAVVIGGACSGGGSSTTSSPASGGETFVPPDRTTTSTVASSTTSSGGSAPTLTLPIPAATRVTIDKLDVAVPSGWKVVRGKDSDTIDGETVKGTDSLCLQAPSTDTDGIPFDCTGVKILTGTAFDNSSEGQTPYDPDSDYQWYPGTDVPACEPDFPLVRSKIVESKLAPISGKQAAYRRLTVQCDKRPTVHEAVSWTLPRSRIAVVSLFHAAEARVVWDSAQLV